MILFGRSSMIGGIVGKGARREAVPLRSRVLLRRVAASILGSSPRSTFEELDFMLLESVSSGPRYLINGVRPFLV